MKHLIATAALIPFAAAPLASFAGQDEAQRQITQRLQEQKMKLAAAEKAYAWALWSSAFLLPWLGLWLLAPSEGLRRSCTVVLCRGLSFYTTWFISVWRFLAALLSAVVYLHFVLRRAERSGPRHMRNQRVRSVNREQFV